MNRSTHAFPLFGTRSYRRAVPRRMPATPWLPQIGLLLLIGLLVWAGMAQLSTPAVQPATIPATEFSAERAAEDLEILAAESRAVGMPGHSESRQYLIDELTAMGLTPEVQQASSVLLFEGADSFNAGQVSNVIARLPGTDNSGAIVLNAHYDSGETGPGASDCGTCVATVLESVRAVQAGEALRNDVIIVFSDAEEHGDLGAAAFNTQHPWAGDARLALNYESQGVGGPAVLYATSNDNGWLVSEFLEAAPNPAAYSLLPEIVSAIPGQRLACDLQDYLDRGNAGLGFVYMSDSAYYHTELDNIVETDLGSVQQQGDYTVALLQHIGNADLSDIPRTGDAVFFNILPGRVISYGSTALLALAALATLMAAALIVAGYRRNRLTISGIAVGAAACLFGSLATVVIIALLWAAIRFANVDYRAILVGSYQTSTFVVAFTLLAVALMSLLYAALRSRVRAIDLAAGALLVWVPLTVLISLAAPGASYLVVWPVLFSLLPIGLVLLGQDQAIRPWLRMTSLALAAAPIIVLLPSTAYGIVAILTRLELMSSLAGSPPVLGLWALFVAPLAALLVLHFDFLAGGAATKRRWLAPAALAVLAVGIIGWANLTSGFSEDQPRPTHIAYELNADTGTARWLSLDPELDAWTQQFFPADPQQEPYEFSAGVERDAFAAAAPVANIEAPVATVVSDARDGTSRTIELLLMSPRDAAELEVHIQGAGAVTRATLEGLTMNLDDYPLAADGELMFSYVAIPDEGVTLILEIAATEPVSVQLEDVTFGLPQFEGLTVTPRPADTMPAPALPLDGTTVIRTYTI